MLLRLGPADQPTSYIQLSRRTCFIPPANIPIPKLNVRAMQAFECLQSVSLSLRHLQRLFACGLCVLWHWQPRTTTTTLLTKGSGGLCAAAAVCDYWYSTASDTTHAQKIHPSNWHTVLSTAMGWLAAVTSHSMSAQVSVLSHHITSHRITAPLSSSRQPALPSLECHSSTEFTCRTNVTTLSRRWRRHNSVVAPLLFHSPGPLLFFCLVDPS